MSVKVWATAALLSGSLVAGACGGDDERALDDPWAAEEPATDAARAPQPTPQPQMGMQQEEQVSGQIEQVDTDAGTFTVTSGGMEHRFSFTDQTAIIGAAGTQGLAANEGDRVTVYYEDLPEGRQAVRVEFENENP